MLQAGLKGAGSIIVSQENTAEAMGSGALPVLATPALVALMEGTAMRSLADCLGAGEGTVGASIHVEHTAATPVGMRVHCESELVEVDGRRLRFAIHAFDAKGPIGTATHIRYIIDNERFLAKAEAKGAL